MLEKLLQSIKGEKKLSYNHWRYRLLHWFYNVKDPHDSPLPKFFYTHYCPLFHMTNIMALSLPLILTFKMLIFSCSRLADLVIYINNKIYYAFEFIYKICDKFYPFKSDPLAKEKVVEKPELTEEQLKALDAKLKLQEFKKLPKVILDYLNSYVEYDPEFWIENITFKKFLHDPMTNKIIKKLISEEIEPFWNKYKDQFVAAKKLAKERKDQLRKNIIFWVNFSRMFIKGTLTVLYAVLFLGALYLTTFYVVPGIFLISSYLFNFNWVSVFTEIVACVKYVSTIILTVLFGMLAIAAFGYYICYPVLKPLFEFIGSILEAFVNKVGKTFNNILDFISMFYEENCPPIVIVEDTEAEISAIGDQE